MLHLNKKLALSAAIVASFSLANAGDIIGAQSAADNSVYYIEVGESTVPFGPHSSGLAGIGSSTTFLFGASSKVDFQGLTSSSKVRKDNVQTTVYNFENSIVTAPRWYDFHRNLGDFNFARAGNADVWFGEWSKTDEFDHRQVYYVGDHENASVPSNGTATYTTYGINKFTGNNLMTGTLTATFGSNGTLTGSLTRAGDTLAINADIYADNAAFTGTAAFNGNAGTSQGHFFGNQATSLAGIAEFTNKDYNTAFGGAKD